MTSVTPITNRRAVVPPRSRGQTLAEFALVLTPLMLILLGIIQMGFIFNAYVTVANAAREGAREASIYVYNYSETKTENDNARATVVRSAVTNSMGLLSSTPPQLTPTSDIVITYGGAADCPATAASDTDPREGQNVCVAVTYHLDFVLPLIAGLLPTDANGRMPINAQVTMVIN